MLRPRPLTFLLALAVSVLGGFAGAALYASVFAGDDDLPGTIVRLRELTDSGIDQSPFCVPAQKFCLVQLSGEVRALYTYDTHAYSRARNCEVRWLPEFSFRDPDTDEDRTGWFRGDCSGTTYRLNGERVFGPGPRDMDRHPARVVTERVPGPDGETITVRYVEVDTGRLICGDAIAGAPGGCEPAPRPR